MSDPNPHYDYATSAFGAANADAEPEFNQEVRADALIQATLALAYEQRTANMLAVLHGPSTLDANYADIKQQIIERLGL